MRQIKNSLYLLVKTKLILLVILPVCITCLLLILMGSNGFDVLNIGPYTPIQLSQGYRWLRYTTTHDEGALIRSSFAFAGVLPIFTVIFGVRTAGLFQGDSRWLVSKSRGISSHHIIIGHLLSTSLFYALTVIATELLMLAIAVFFYKGDLSQYFNLLLASLLPCALVNLLLLSLLFMSMALYQIFRNSITASLVAFASYFESITQYHSGKISGLFSYFFDETIYQIGPYFSVAGGMGYEVIPKIQILIYALCTILLFVAVYIVLYYLRDSHEASN